MLQLAFLYVPLPLVLYVVVVVVVVARQHMKMRLSISIHASSTVCDRWLFEWVQCCCMDASFSVRQVQVQCLDYGSGTVAGNRRAAAPSRRVFNWITTKQNYSPCSREMTSRPPCRNIRNPAPAIDARTYLKNNPAKFHPDPIWNDGVLGHWLWCQSIARMRFPIST